MRLQPRGHCRDIGISRTVEAAQLLRLQPLVIAGAAGSVGIVNEFAERELLFRRPLEQQKHALRRKRVGNCALVKARLGERMHVALKSDAKAIVDRLGDARRGLGLREREAAGDSSEQTQETKKPGTREGAKHLDLPIRRLQRPFTKARARQRRSGPIRAIVRRGQGAAERGSWMEIQLPSKLCKQ